MNNKRIVVLIIVVIVMILFPVLYITSRQKDVVGSKIIFVEEAENGFIVWVANNDESKSNKKMIYYEKRAKENIGFREINFFVLMGAHLKGKKLYYADMNKKVISSYDVVDNERKEIISGALYPFCVDDSGSLFVYYVGENDRREKAYKLFDAKSKYSEEFSFDCGLVERPLKVFNSKYVLFDKTRYYTEAPIFYFLYDIKNHKIMFDEAFHVAICGDLVAYLGGFRKREKDSYIEHIGLIILNMKTGKILKQIKYDDFLPSDEIGIQYLSFSKDGKKVEMWGDLFKKKGKNELLERKILASYDYEKNKLRISDRKVEIPKNNFKMNFTRIIGVYNP